MNPPNILALKRRRDARSPPRRDGHVPKSFYLVMGLQHVVTVRSPYSFHCTGRSLIKQADPLLSSGGYDTLSGALICIV